jgi:hypothetical protein
MNWYDWCAVISAGIGALLGLYGFLSPRAVIHTVGLRFDADKGHSVSEGRATYGGFFLGLEGAVLITRDTGAFTVVGVAWLVTALARLISIWGDRASTPFNWKAVGFEVLMGAAHLAPLIAVMV